MLFEPACGASAAISARRAATMLRHGCVRGSIGEQRLQRGLGFSGIAALQRRLGAIKAGPRIVGGFGELGHRGRCHGSSGS